MYRLLAFVTCLAACGKDDDTHDGFTTHTTTNSQEGSCDLVEDRAVAIDEFQIDLGLSAQDALNEMTGVSNTTNVFAWPDESTINLEVEFVYTTGAIHYRDRESSGVLPPDELARCFTAVEIDGELSFATGDGRFAETVAVTLQAKDRREGALYFDLAPGDLAGTWVPEDSGIDGAAYPAITLRFDGVITDVGSEGEVWAISGEEALAVGSWAPPPTQGR